MAVFYSAYMQDKIPQISVVQRMEMHNLAGFASCKFLFLMSVKFLQLKFHQICAVAVHLNLYLYEKVFISSNQTSEFDKEGQML